MDFSHVTSLTIPEGNVKAIYCNDVKLWGVSGTYENTITGVPPLTLANCTGDDLVNWSIVGNTIQNGTPSPENPIDVQGVGDWDETEQKYKIPVKSNDTITNIYLDSPLMQGETITSDGEREVVWGVVENYNNFIFSSYTTGRTVIRKNNTGIGTNEYFCTHTNSVALATSIRVVLDYSHLATIYISIPDTFSGVTQYDTNDEKVIKVTEYLNNTNMKIYYQLANPTSETFTPPTIPTETGTTVLDTECGVSPSGMTVTFMSTTPQNEEAR